MANIYVLRLTNNKYYIGKTNRSVEKRYQEHLKGRGASWTKKYYPLEIIREIHNQSIFDEDRYTKEYMHLYGIDNVRGGAYVRHILHPNEIKLIKKEIWAATNCCMKCGSKLHYSKNCDDKN